MNSLKTTTLLLVLISLLQGCASTVPRNELQNLPSLIEVVVLDVADSKLKVRLTHRHNDPREDIQLNCQLAAKDYPAIEFQPIAVPDMTSYATETLDLTATQTISAALSEQANIPYVLECFLSSSNFKRENLIRRSTLYRVPGTANQYR